MKPTVLQPDQRQSFDENGYLVVRSTHGDRGGGADAD